MKGINVSIILTTTDNKKNAELIAQTLVESKLAACVQIDEVESIFYYEAKCMKHKEFRLMIKAASDNYKAIERLIESNHDYHLPQIIKFDITDGLPEYINWIQGKQ